MPHSHIVTRLRAEVIESELLYTGSLAYMQAIGSMYANPAADIEKGNEAVNTMYMDARSRIPYLTGGMSGKESIDSDREKAVQDYHTMKNRMRKNA